METGLGDAGDDDALGEVRSWWMVHWLQVEVVVTPERGVKVLVRRR